MGNLSSQIAPVRVDVNEIADIHYEKGLGNSRFMRCIRCRHHEGPVVVKVFVKPVSGISLSKYIQDIQAEKQILQDIPNCFPYQRLLETDKAGYLLRQFFIHNLYDRISTRPFLNLIEKKWIAFQILCGISEAHSHQIFHGDLKTENVMVTSWNWVYITDFCSFKPTYLPEDNPADFSYFFDTSSRRTCYVAPERFFVPGDALFNEKSGRLTAAMDIFSLGCTIAEIFLEGTPLFSFSQLLRYRNGEYDPCPMLEKIEDVHIQSLVRHMIQLDPKHRYSADDYLSRWMKTAFPEYFYTFLHKYMASLNEKRGRLEAGFDYSMADFKMDKLWNDFDKIAIAIGMGENLAQDHSENVLNASKKGGSFTIFIPNFRKKASSLKKIPESEDGCLIFCTVILSTLRNLLRPSSKIKALDILFALGLQLADDIKLDRIVPYVMTMMEDENATVRLTVLQMLTELLKTVETLTVADVNIFPEYIIPSLQKYSYDPDVIVRSAFAVSIASIAETAMQFLELSQLFENKSADLDAENTLDRMMYDSALRDLQESVQELVVGLLTDPETMVKRCLLAEMPRLCIFFGRKKTNDILLSHMITYLNDPDWMLRSSFFESVIGIATFVGSQSLQEYILPLMMQSLTDAEEFVVEKVLIALCSLAELHLIQKSKLKEIIPTLLPVLYHPNPWIRNNAAFFISICAKCFPLMDVRCILYPMLKPFLNDDIYEITETNILDNLKPEISRTLYDQTLLLASKTTQLRSESSTHDRKGNRDDVGPKESNDLLKKLRELGMSDEEKEKLLTLKYYIYKISQSKLRNPSQGVKWVQSSMGTTAAKQIELKHFSVTPQTVFLTPPTREPLKNVELVDSNVYHRLSRVASESNMKQSITITKSRPILVPVEKTTSLSGMGEQEGDAVSLSNMPKSHSSSTSSSHGLKSSRMASSAMLGSGKVKVPAAVSTFSENAHATIDVHGQTKPRVKQRKNSDTSSIVTAMSAMSAGIEPTEKTMAPMNYDRYISGAFQESYIQRLMEKKATELFPPAILEMGPKIPEFRGYGPIVSSGKKRVAKGAATPPDIKTWRPEGTLIARLTEHQGAVNKIALSPDHSFFATCSDDGSTLIWDTQRLEKNVTNRPRLKIANQGGKIKTVGFCEHRHSIISASDNGSLFLSRIEYMGGSKYGSSNTFQKLTLDDSDYVLHVDHFNTESGSVLVYATVQGNLCGLDLRTMKQVWKFNSPPHHGLLSSMLVDAKKNWLVSGSSRGVFSLWDVRFGLNVKTFAHPGRSRISKMIHPSCSLGGEHDAILKSNHGVLAAVDGRYSEISAWDLYTGECRQVWCALGGNRNTLKSGSTNSFDADAEMSRLYQDGVQSVSALDPFTTLDHYSFKTPDSQSSKAPPTINIHGLVQPEDAPFILSGGDDRMIRFWDLTKPESSFVVSGLDSDDAMPKYSTSLYKDIRFTIEHTPTHSFSSHYHQGKSSKSGVSHTNSYRGYQRTNDALTKGSSGVFMDSISDLCLTQVPYPMIIGCSYDGIINVYK